MEEKAKRKIGLGFILGWLFGLLFLALGLITSVISLFGGIFIIIGALLIFPPFGNYLEAKHNIVLSGWLKFIGFLFLIVIGFNMVDSAASPSSAPMSSSSTLKSYSSDTLPPEITSLTTPTTSTTTTTIPLVGEPSIVALKLTDFEVGWMKNSEKTTNNSYTVKFVKQSTYTIELIENQVTAYPNVQAAKNAYQQEKNKIIETFSTEEIDIGESGFIYKPEDSQLYLIFVDENVVVSIFNYKDYGYTSVRFNAGLARKIDKRI